VVPQAARARGRTRPRVPPSNLPPLGGGKAPGLGAMDDKLRRFFLRESAWVLRTANGPASLAGLESVDTDNDW
jgi:hypothetical protein